MADINKLKDKIKSTIYPNGKGAINASDHQALLLDMADGMAEADTKLTELKSYFQWNDNILQPLHFGIPQLVNIGYVKTDGTIASPTGTPWRYSNFIPIKGGSSISANLSPGANAAVVAYYSSDSEDSFISNWDGNTGSEISSTVPQNANYLRFCSYWDNNNSSLIVDGYAEGSFLVSGMQQALNESRQTLNELLHIVNIKDNIVKPITIGNDAFSLVGKYINTSGVATNSPVWNYTDFLPIVGGTQIRCKLSIGSGNAIVAFYTAQNESSFISGFNGNTGSEVTANVPQNATYFRACTRVPPSSTYVPDAFITYQGTARDSKRFVDIENELQTVDLRVTSLESQVGKLTTTKSWVSIGDSITWLNDNPGGSRPQHGYQWYLQERIQFGSFVNKGVNGATMLEYPYHTIGVADIYTIALGINDWGATHLTPVGTIADYKAFTSGSPTNYAQALKRLVNQIRTNNATAFIILITPRRAYNFNGYLPNSSLDANAAGVYLHEYVDILNEVAKYESFPIVDQYYNSGINDSNLPAYCYDTCLHPNDAGMKIIANMLYPVMEKLVR